MLSMSPIIWWGSPSLPVLDRQCLFVSSVTEFFFHFLLGFSIKAVPFPNAILNVKELGGKKLVPNMTRKSLIFTFLPLENFFE